MKKLIPFCLFLLSLRAGVSVAQAQSTDAVLQGKVVDEKGQPLEFVTVFLMREGTSQSVKGTVTNTKGEFTLSYPAQEGKFRLGLTYLGYQPYQSEPFSLTTLNLGTLKMKASEQALKEVKVFGQKNLITAQDGNLTVNVERSITAQGGTAFDVLSTAPGVVIHRDNDITLNGKSGVRLMLDGKLVYLESADLVALLKTLPASSISAIDLLVNPGVQFDAAGTAGLINIRTKKNVEFGMNGSVTAGVAGWVTPKQNLALNLNSRKGNWNVYGAYSHLLGQYAYDYGFTRGQNNLYYESITDDADTRNRVNASVGIDYRLTPKQTIGVAASANLFFSKDNEGGYTHTQTNIFNEGSQEPFRILYANNDYYQQHSNRYNASANYRYAHDTTGRVFSLTTDYGFFDTSNKNRLDNAYVTPSGEELQRQLHRATSEVGVHLYAVKVDLEDSLGRGKYLLGAKYSIVRSDNAYHLFENLPQGEVLDENQSNDFSYQERIAAAYASYRLPLSKKLSLQAGLRLEHTQADGQLSYLTGDQRAGQKVENEYWNLFPAASITFTANENNRLSVAYTRRLDRPAYQRLNPFITLLDDITFWQGNAFLRPQYANRFSLDYSHGSGTVFSLAYSRTTDMMAQVDDTLDVNKVVMTPRNVGRQNHFSLNVTRTIKFTNWWEASASGLLYYVDNLIVFDAKRRFELDATAYNLNLQQTFRIPRDFTFELTGNYNSSTVTSGNRRSRANGAVNVGLRKKLSEKSTLSLAMTDVFLTSRWNNISAFNGFYYRSFGHGESRQVRLNFTYTFGQKKIQAPKKRDSALDTENNRLN